MSNYETVKHAHEQEFLQKTQELYRVNAHRKAVLKRLNELEIILAIADHLKPEPIKPVPTEDGLLARAKANEIDPDLPLPVPEDEEQII